MFYRLCIQLFFEAQHVQEIEQKPGLFDCSHYLNIAAVQLVSLSTIWYIKNSISDLLFTFVWAAQKQVQIGLSFSRILARAHRLQFSTKSIYSLF